MHPTINFAATPESSRITVAQLAPQLLVIDSQVQPLAPLLAAVRHDWQVVVLNPQTDGIEVISAYLSQGSYRRLAIVAHGEPGQVRLGASLLNHAALSYYSPLLAEWAVEQIDLWSCQVGQDAAFVQAFSQLTGAKVHASEQLLGQGSWNLQRVEAPFSSETLANWPGILALPVNPSFENGFNGWTIIPAVPPPGFLFDSSATVVNSTDNAAPTDGSSFASLVIQSPNPGIPRGETAYGVTIRSSIFSLTAGETIGLDFQPFEDENVGSTDDTAVRIFLYDAVTDSPVATLVDGTFNGAPGWLVAGTTAPATGNYYLTTQVGSYDETFGLVIGAELYVDNIRNGVVPSLTADIIDVPDRITPLDTVIVDFTEPIDPASFGPEDLRLTLEEDINTNLIDGGVTITPVPGTVSSYQINGLGTLTGDLGLYRLFVDATGVIEQATGNPGFGNAFESWSLVDDLPPVVTVDIFSTTDSTPPLTGTVDDPDAVVEVTIDGNTYTATNNQDGTWVVPDNVITPALPQGFYDIVVRATDVNGNVGGDSTFTELLVLQETTGYFNFNQFTRSRLIDDDIDIPFSPIEINGLSLPLLYDETYYLSQYADVAAAVEAGTFVSGYDHFSAFGLFEGRNPSILFDEQFYLSQNPDVEAAIANDLISSGLEHFLLSGSIEERDPSAFFDESDYLLNNPDVAAGVENGWFVSGFDHYISAGASEGRLPNLIYFNEAYYLDRYADVRASVLEGNFDSGFEHYVIFGQRERRDPSSLFDEEVYLLRYPDVANAVGVGAFSSGFEHFILAGRAEGRTSTAVLDL